MWYILNGLDILLIIKYAIVPIIQTYTWTASFVWLADFSLYQYRVLI